MSWTDVVPFMKEEIPLRANTEQGERMSRLSYAYELLRAIPLNDSVRLTNSTLIDWPTQILVRHRCPPSR